jgi:hypothetical protein
MPRFKRGQGTWSLAHSSQQKKRTRISPLLCSSWSSRDSLDLAAVRSVLCAALGNRLLTLLVRDLADDKVEHARDDAIKFVAGQAGAIAFN